MMDTVTQLIILGVIFSSQTHAGALNGSSNSDLVFRNESSCCVLDHYCRIENRSISSGGLTVDCSYSGCKCIPFDQIPVDTVTLILNSNSLRILGDNSFENFSSLLNVSLKRNLIWKLESKAFNGLHLLQSLDLSSNIFESLPAFIFTPLKSLETILLRNISANSDLFKTTAFVNLSRLNTFDFSKNRQFSMPPFKYQRKSVTRNLHVLILAFNFIEVLQTKLFAGLESVQELYLNDNRIRVIQPHCFKYLKRLRVLVLSQNELGVIDGLAFVSESLQFLDLGNSKLKLKQENNMIFARIPNLNKLLLSSCNFRNIGSFNRLFSNVTELRNLNLKSCKLSDKVLPILLKNLTKVENLNLADNNIISLQPDTFESMSGSLRSLYLSSNRITTVNRSSLPENVWSGLKKIDLTDNPWNCDCSLVWFRKWLNTTPIDVMQRKEPGQYKCSGGGENVKKTPLVNLKHPTELECFEVEQDICTVSILVCVFVFDLLVSTSAVLYRFRWHVRYWHFIYKTNRRIFKEQSSKQEYEFDAFVSYSAKDLGWVKKHLPRLETDYNLRLCLHDRDWLAGRDIIENIVQSIENSRMIVLIVSNAFAISQWCHMELAMIQTKMFETNHDNVVLVLLEELIDCNVSSRLKIQMQRQTYIEWPADSVTGQQLFWARLSQTLAQPTRNDTRPAKQHLFVRS